MGVELGKVLAKNILAQLNKPEDVVGHDSSVSGACFTNFRDELTNTWIDDRLDPLLPEAPRDLVIIE